MNPGISEEVGKATGTFMGIMRESPLSLALVIMNFLIVVYLFYSGAQQLSQRKQMAEMIVEWSKETGKILGSCVSIDTMKLVVDALERDRSLYRELLPHVPRVPEPQPQPAPLPQNNKAPLLDLTLPRLENIGGIPFPRERPKE